MNTIKLSESLQNAYDNRDIPMQLSLDKIKRVFYIEDVRALVNLYDKEELSISRFAELLNVMSYLAGASAMNGSAGVHWRPISVKPPEEKQVLFDAVEDPPVWGKYRRKGKFDYVITQDSSGEENYHALSDYSRWLDESVSSPSPQTVEEIVKQEKIKLIWEMIQAWQDSRDKDTDIDAQQYSAQDIEVDLYDWLEKVDPKAPAQKPSSPSPLEAETADKKRIAELEFSNRRLMENVKSLEDLLKIAKRVH